VSVYVDGAKNPLGRMKMCHMIADTREELVAMVDRIGVDRRHIQFVGTPREHFDICKSKRALAVKAGAIEVSPRELLGIMGAKPRDGGTDHE